METVTVNFLDTTQVKDTTYNFDMIDNSLTFILHGREKDGKCTNVKNSGYATLGFIIA